MKWAYNENGVLWDVVMTHPSILFPQSYADQFIEVPDEAFNGWLWDGETASEPPAPEPAPPPPPPTKEELLTQLQALQAQIIALGD
jgi:hypothetical protein